MAALERAGAESVLLASKEAGGRDVGGLLDSLDGILFTGGGDIDPRYYGEPMAGSEAEYMDAARDVFELALAKEALQRDATVLGICRGFQLLNVALGGKLAQHVDHLRVGGAS